MFYEKRFYGRERALRNKGLYRKEYILYVWLLYRLYTSTSRGSPL